MTVQSLQVRRLAIGLTFDGLGVALLAMAVAMGGAEVKATLLLALPGALIATTGAIMTGLVIVSTQPEGWRLAVAVLAVVLLTVAVIPVGVVVLGFPPP